MPVYDYVCTSCRHRFEVFHGLNESGPHQCPLCEGAVTRAFAPPTIHFKGSGWAKNDRRSSATSTKRAAAGQAKGGGSTSGEAPPAGSTSAGSTSAGSTSGESSSGEVPSGSSTSTSSGSGD